VARWLLALLFIARSPAAAQNPIAQVKIYTDLHPNGIDTAVLHRPSWGVIRASVVREDGQIDRTTAVKWRTQDSTKVRLRQRKPQSVAIESPMPARLGTTRVIVDAGARHDTLVVVVRNGLARLQLDSATYHVDLRGTRQTCAWMVTSTGGRILTTQSAQVTYCAERYPNR